jgi:hypothetical protein
MDEAMFNIRTKPVYLTQQEYAQALHDEIVKIRGQTQLPVLIVIDTLARNFGPGSESSDEDMGAFINNMIDIVVHPTNATCLVVHHPGHGDQDRGRGHSSLPAAVDGTLKIAKEGDIVTLSTTEMRNTKGDEKYSFRIEQEDLPEFDNFKNQIKVPVMVFVPDWQPVAISMPTGYEKTLVEIIRHLANGQVKMLESQGVHVPDTIIVLADEVKEKFYASEGATDKKSRDKFYKSFNRLHDQLAARFDGARPNFLVKTENFSTEW